MEPPKSADSPSSSSPDLSTLPYISPTLEALQLADKLTPFPACAMCPVAIWYKTQKTLNCFCSRMHALTWNGKEPPVLNCDGQFMAILQMESEQAGGA